MRLLLTGGTGFFGRALLRKILFDSNHGVAPPQVTVMTRSVAAFLDKYPEFSNHYWLTYHQGDVLDPGLFPSGKDFTHILHAATESTRGPYLTPLRRYDEITHGTRNILEFARNLDDCRVLVTSSGGVYGAQPDSLEFIPETYLGIPDPLDPSSAYSLGKRAMEHLCALYGDAYGLKITIARCFSFVGKDLPLNAHFAIGNFINDALNSEVIRVTGDGAPIRSYMNQNDLAHWLLEILKYGDVGEAYNVGSNQAISIGDLAILVSDVLNAGKPVVFENSAEIFRGRDRYVPDTTRAQTSLQLQETISLTDSIAEFLAPTS